MDYMCLLISDGGVAIRGERLKATSLPDAQAKVKERQGNGSAVAGYEIWAGSEMVAREGVALRKGG